MESAATKREIIEKLQKDILALQGFRELATAPVKMGLGPLETAFPNNIFPIGAIHEFISSAREDAAATAGFISALVGRLMQQSGPCLWVSTRRILFPPALKAFGINPERVIFIDVKREKDLLWTIEEALKCQALSAVVGELGALSFTESRRLQLAVEQSRVTGLMHCYNPEKIASTTSVARWKITPLSSILEDGMPGVGHPHWQASLLKIRNGKPGTWQLHWSAGAFQYANQAGQSAKSGLQKIA